MFPDLIKSLTELTANFKAGEVSCHFDTWESLTSDPEILQIVQGDVINFTYKPPISHTARKCQVCPYTGPYGYRN